MNFVENDPVDAQSNIRLYARDYSGAPLVRNEVMFESHGIP